MKTYAMTGGASGIGAAIKQSLLDAGHQLIVVDIASADIEADLSSSGGREAAIEGIVAAAPEGLDGFIACAGVGSHVPNLPLIAAVNYRGTTELVEGLRESLARKNGAVVLISSNSAPMDTNPAYVEALLDGDDAALVTQLESMEGQTVYSGSKQAVARWMRRNVVDYAAQGIRMNAVAPGYTETPMTAAVKDDPTYGEAIRQFVATIPVGRPGEPEDMAKAVSFLLSEDASFISGSVLFVDGGHDAMMRPDQF
ncbi:MAG: SDR family oxidoreductase [Halieaceae bacterium]|jgi:NAD(P)-dependent dehydrogenase (short-subunit alcohol dehydrogenase family)|nr:SDR family oxidoreductase [Halieaceae bacterium]